MWSVIVEWDGRKPSTKFYNRLRKMNLAVRGDMSIGPVARRSNEDGSVIIQEGAFFCASETLAREIAQLAQIDGAKFVVLGQINDTEEYRATPEDRATFERLEATFGRRGRPTEEEADWLVTCLEEGRTFDVRQRAFVVNCPNCHGLRIRSRKDAHPYYFQLPKHGDTFDLWTRTHFSQGMYEKPDRDGMFADLAQLPRSVKPSVPVEAETVQKLSRSTDLLDRIKMVDRELAFQILSAVFTARTWIPKASRLHPRVEAVTHLFESGGSAVGVSLAEDPDTFDLLDAAAVLGTQMTAQYWLVTQP